MKEEKFKYKDFVIKFGSYLSEGCVVHIENKKWKKIAYISMVSLRNDNLFGLDDLKERTREFLKNPDLRNAEKEGFKIFYNDIQTGEEFEIEEQDFGDDLYYEELDREKEMYEQEKWLSDYERYGGYDEEPPYNSIDDAHSLEWNEEDQDWSNDDQR